MFINSSDLDVRSTEEKEKEKSVKMNAFVTKGARDDIEVYSDGIVDSDDEEEVNAFYGKTSNKQAEHEFCQKYLEYDKAFVKKVNDTLGIKGK